jgi:hypothetical protein
MQSADREPGVGWMLLAGTVLGIAGIMRIFDAIWAFRFNGQLPENFDGAVLGTSLTTYGWLYLIIGVVLIVASLAVLTESQFARWIGIAAGAIGAISAIAWMPYYPVWSITYIVLGVLVIYALAVYGGRDTLAG